MIGTREVLSFVISSSFMEIRSYVSKLEKNDEVLNR